MSDRAIYVLAMVVLCVLIGVGVGMTFGGWLGMSAGLASWVLAPQIKL